MKPVALGVMNEIVVVSDQNIWDGAIGDSLDYYFGGAYPITPQAEPIFDLRHFAIDELVAQPLRKRLRTYLIVADLADPSSETAEMIRKDLGTDGVNRAMSDATFTTSVGKDKWATGQILIYLFANGYDALASAIRVNFSSISTRVRQHDDRQLTQSTYTRGVNKGLSRQIGQLIGVSIEVPFEYFVAKEVQKENLVWLRKDTKNATLSLVLKKEKYTSDSQLTKSYMKGIRDDIGRRYVSSPEDNSYMLINDEDLPILEYSKEINGLYAREYRGIWEMENDFMGGPFMTYLLVNGEDLIYIDAFILALGKDKRNYMQQLEKIVSTVNKNLQ